MNLACLLNSSIFMVTPSMLFVFSTKRERIKLAPLILEAKKRMLPVYTCFTGGKKLRATINKNEISFLVVHGQTRIATKAVMAAFRSGIEVVHIEAGLPVARQKEINQWVINHLTKWHFVASKNSERNLLAEGFRKENIFLVENASPNSFAYAAKTIIDTLANQTFLKIS